jgi:hypothetical protein
MEEFEMFGLFLIIFFVMSGICFSTSYFLAQEINYIIDREAVELP